ncbi:hypothetical protein VB711_25020 [Cronbergia sp. UHCC 0137]|uniref:hypothetical protein n=1 Tax=Cronbergia sp. UHCC 0137 TaxID=3110239 RepID=UPI002B1ED874|nr:hypothetical protein [Cronbergia sp. UHCC 0137]MEA5621070.1 hypothetical protein [Cronbergia sp. UHCC 0137]
MNTKEQLQAPPETFISPLLELRDYYAGLVEKYERLFVQARSQLDHTEALLSNWDVPDDNRQFSQLEGNDKTLASSSESSMLFLSSHHKSDIDLLESIELELENSHKLHQQSSTFTSTESLTYPTAKTSLEGQDPFIKGAEIPMLPQYDSLTRMEALKDLMQDYAGTVCHIDFIVRSLYGELESTIFRIVKGRVQSSLTQGRERGYWTSIPNEPGCYTLDLSLLTTTNNNGFPQSFKPKRKKPFIIPKTKVVPMRQVFEGQFLIDALTSFLEQNPGQVFNVAEIVNGIYGELNSQQLREVKNKVLNELSRGHRTGRFSRVPHQIGLYTWDAKMISSSQFQNKTYTPHI